MTTPAQPGWYPDPTGEPQARYWDGVQWTSSTQFGGAPLRTGLNAGAKAAIAVTVVLSVVVLVAGALGLRALSSGDSDELVAEATTSDRFADAPPEPVTGAPAGPCTFEEDGAPARPVSPPTEADVVTSGTYDVVLTTSAGEVGFQVDAARTPCALGSLRSLARQGYFEGSPCHRLTTGGLAVLQCGDPTGTGSGGPGYGYADEALEGATYPRGTVALANSGPDTNGSQFFLVYEDAQLPPAYTPLGRITSGLEVLQRLAAAGVAGGGSDGPPATPVQLTRVTVQAR